MDEPAEDVSRRELLRKGVVAGGMVWAAPVVMSIRTRDGAQGTPAPSTTRTGSTVVSPGSTQPPTPGRCDQTTAFKMCGDTLTTCGDQDDCYCVGTTEGDIACATDLDDACTSSARRCRASSECPSREPICITVDNCCGDGFGRCVQRCPGVKPGSYKRKGTALTPLG